VRKALRNQVAVANGLDLVPKKGLEPPHPCGYMDLNHARLPIPPLRHVTALRSSLAGCCQEELEVLFYRGSRVCQTCCASDTCEALYSEYGSDRISRQGILRTAAKVKVKPQGPEWIEPKNSRPLSLLNSAA
jgi:hypothetical protein